MTLMNKIIALLYFHQRTDANPVFSLFLLFLLSNESLSKELRFRKNIELILRQRESALKETSAKLHAVLLLIPYKIAIRKISRYAVFPKFFGKS